MTVTVRSSGKPDTRHHDLSLVSDVDQRNTFVISVVIIEVDKI